ncbi:hypothetical protein NMY22_g10401 [Coprinellus aureogranulatus]|nr:hypothetical protein NMY22_g10401 [Coprinellus aureogranulatus]
MRWSSISTYGVFFVYPSRLSGDHTPENAPVHLTADLLLPAPIYPLTVDRITRLPDSPTDHTALVLDRLPAIGSMEYVDTVGILKAVAAKKEGAYVLVSREKEGDKWTVTNLQGTGSKADIEERLKLAVRLDDDVPVPVEDPVALDEDIAEMGEGDLLVVEEVNDEEVEAVESEVKDQAEREAEDEIDLLMSRMPQLSLKGGLGSSSVDESTDTSLQDIPPIQLDKFVSALGMGIDTQATGDDLDVTKIGDEEVWQDDKVEGQGSNRGDDGADSDSDGGLQFISKYFTPHKPNPHRVFSTKKGRLNPLFTTTRGDEVQNSPHSKGDGDERGSGGDLGQVRREPKIPRPRLGCHRRDLLSRTLGSGLHFLMLCVAWNEWTRARSSWCYAPYLISPHPRSRLAWLSRHLISRCARSILSPVPGHCPMVDLAECCARDCHSLRQSPFEAPDRSRRVLPSIDINLELSAHSRSYLGAILTLAIEPDPLMAPIPLDSSYESS